MERLPLDAKLLGNAVIELNIARHILPLYPREHQLVQTTLDKTYAILQELFEMRPEITLAIAKDTLIIDDQQLDPKNAVYREFALALSALSIAYVSFVKGLTPQEFYEFFRFLSRDPADLTAETLPDVIAEYRLQHVLVQPLDYRAFAFKAGQISRGGADPYLLERHIKALVEGGLPAEGLRQLTDGIEPAALAELLNRAEIGDAGESAYEKVVSSYLRGGSGRPFSGQDLQRLMGFIEGLRPELKRQFLASSVRAFSGDTAALGQALEEVSIDRIIDFFGEVNRNNLALPAALTTLIARFARTGVELPGGGLNVDDVLLSKELADLFREEQSPLGPSESYQEEIDRLLKARSADQETPGLVIEHELDEDYVAYCRASALLTLLDTPQPQLITLEDEDVYAKVFIALARRENAAGQYGQLLELLSRLEDLARRGRHRGVVEAVLEACREADFIEAVTESFSRHGRANRAGAAQVCARLGPAIVPPLFDRLALEQRAHVRKLLLGLLAGLGEHAAAEATRRLADPRWHVRRNALYLIAESGARCEPQVLAEAGRDPDPRVRLESARCQVRAGNSDGVAALRVLLYEKAEGVADAAVLAAATLGVKELLPELVALSRGTVTKAKLRSRLRLVRAIGQLGGQDAVEPLEALLRKRAFLFPRENARLRGEIRKALARLARRRAPAPDSAAGEAGALGSGPGAEGAP